MKDTLSLQPDSISKTSDSRLPAACCPLPLMAHLVLGYPTLAESLRTAEAYIAAGCEILELQIPFSHPTADGPLITEACRHAVEKNGVDIEACLELVAEIRRRHPQQNIVMMSYINPLFVFGLEKIAEKFLALGINYLIVPDLPVDSPQATLLQTPNSLLQTPNSKLQTLTSLQLIPVLAANVTDQRLEKLLTAGFDFFYLMSDFKITGATFSLHPRLNAIITRLHAAGARCGIGFGISTPQQAKLAVEVCGLAIVGSAFIRARNENRLQHCLDEWQSAFNPQPLAAF